MTNLWWYIANIGFPLLAIPLVWGGTWIKFGLPKVAWGAGTADGQICYFSIALSAVTLYDVSRSQHNNTPAYIGGILGCVFCLFLSTFIFGIAVVEARADAAAKKRMVGSSIFTTVVTLIVVLPVRHVLGLIP